MTLRLALSGARAGPHVLRWRMGVGGYKVEIERSRRLDLRAGENEVEIEVPAREVGELFRDAAMTDRSADAAADLNVEVSIRLTPELSDGDRARMPLHEVQNLDRGGFSALADNHAMSLRLRYEFRGGEVFVRP